VTDRYYKYVNISKRERKNSVTVYVERILAKKFEILVHFGSRNLSGKGIMPLHALRFLIQDSFVSAIKFDLVGYYKVLKVFCKSHLQLLANSENEPDLRFS
jgi:hypothetical protein